MYNGKKLNWCLFKPEQLEKLLRTDLGRGLTGTEALMRNAGADTAGRELRELFFPFTAFFRFVGAAFCDFSVMALFIAAVISTAVSGKGYASVAAIAVFIAACAGIRTVIAMYDRHLDRRGTQEDLYTVLRDGKKKRVKGAFLASGDVIFLGKGDIAPCDIRLVITRDFNVIEKYGDKRVRPVEKDADYYPANPAGKIALRFKKNMLFKGSAAASGEAVGVVLDGGMTFEQASAVLGLAPSMRKVFEYEDRQESFDIFSRLSRKSAFGAQEIRSANYSEDDTVKMNSERLMTVTRVCAMCIGALVFVLALMSKTLVTDAFLFAVTVMACAPSVLYDMCISAAFFAGRARLAGQNVYIRDFESAEKLALSKSVILCGSTGFRIKTMSTVGVYFGSRYIELEKSRPAQVKTFFEILLCVTSLKYRQERSGELKVEGEPDDVANYNGAMLYAGMQPGDEREYMEANNRFYDLNGALGGASISLGNSSSMLITKGTVAAVLSKCSHYLTEHGEIAELCEKSRIKIMKSARNAENSEGSKVVALCGRYSLPAAGDGEKNQGGSVFVGFVVYKTEVSLEGVRHVEKMRENGIKPIICTGEASDMVIGNARQIGILRKGDNYITSKIYDSQDEKIFAGEFDTYSLFMNVDSSVKRVIVMNKKQSEGVVAVAADKPSDAFDMSEADVLISCGRDAPRMLQRISDIHTDNGGVVGVYRTICICRNMIRSASLATGYLVAAQCAAMVFCLFGALASFFWGGRLPMEMPQLFCAVFVTDLALALLSAIIKTPKSIISDTPSEFYSYYQMPRILPKALLSGLLCGFVSFLALLAGLLVTKNAQAGAACGFFVMYLSKALVSLLCIMRTSTRNAPAPTPVAPFVAQLICGTAFALLFGSAFLPFSYGFPATAVCAILAFVPSMLTLMFVRMDDRK